MYSVASGRYRPNCDIGRAGSGRPLPDPTADLGTLSVQEFALARGFHRHSTSIAPRRSPGASYIQHSAHIPPGREGLFALIKGAPEALHYENGLTASNGDYVLLHGRFSGLGRPANWIVVDIVRLENGRLAEHWDVIEDEATKEASVSGLPMFGTTFPSG